MGVISLRAAWGARPVVTQDPLGPQHPPLTPGPPTGDPARPMSLPSSLRVARSDMTAPQMKYSFISEEYQRRLAGEFSANFQPYD